MIYLDHAATSPALQCAKVAFNAISATIWGNPNSLHSFGQDARKMLESSRETVARCLGCEPEQVFFVSSATEACRIALAIMGFIAGNDNAFIVGLVASTVNGVGSQLARLLENNKKENN